MFTKALKNAKSNLVDKNSDFKDIIFFLTIPGEPKISIDSAIEINEKNNLLNELIDSKS
ncbi:hypothetical protein G9F32_16405 [Acinetobacter sp. 194]|uniref:hypothetical protein n=1 Tax=Acinetobacter shaoyimingii TaxID=2715164 RepID=UPI00140A72C1|nr:hypothetical protein [Acinetobacter shaoyimingii]NHB59577.1 hypothetical protein [Acinetobacter shaoyimingii]